MKNRDALLKKARHSNKDVSWQAYKKSRNKCTNEISTEKSNCNRNLLTENAGNPRKFWQTIKNIFPTKSKNDNGNSRWLENDKTKVNKPQEKVDMFCNFFTNVASTLKQNTIRLKDFIWHRPNIRVKLRTCKKFKFTYVSNAFILNELKN